MGKILAFVRLLLWIGVPSLTWAGFLQSAHAGPRFSIFSIAAQTSYISGTTTDKGKFAPGGGFNLEFPLSPYYGFELGASYVKRSGINSTTAIEIPAILRFRWPFSFLSVGGGASYAQGFGNVTTSSGTSTYEQAGFDKTNLSLLGSVGIDIPVKTFQLMFEGRYCYGIYNVSNVTDVVARFDQVQALFGVRF